MDPEAASTQGHHLPFPFHTRIFQHPLHLQQRQQQLNQQRPSSEDDLNSLHRCPKDELDENNTVNGATTPCASPRQPGAVFALHGRFEILFLSGSFLPPPAPPAGMGLTVYLSGSQEKIVGGSVVGELITSGRVVIMYL